jgi:hypothetical protein
MKGWLTEKPEQVLGAVDLAHGLFWVGSSLFDILGTLEPVEQVVAERLVEVEGDAGDDLREECGGAAARRNSVSGESC